MKIVLAFAMLVSLLSACGGGGGAAGESVAVEVPSVSLQSGSIARTVVSGTTVTVDVTVLSIDFSFVGELRVSSESAVGLFLPAVSVKPLGNSRYKLSLASSTTVLPGRYTGTVVISLCGEPTCATRQVVPLIAVPFDVNVMSHNSLWPGDNLTTLQAWQGAPDWGTFQGNAAHTGFVPVDINPDQIRTRWSSPFVNPTGGRYVVGDNYLGRAVRIIDAN